MTQAVRRFGGYLGRMEAILNNTRVEQEVIRLTGGLNETTPPYEMAPGFVRLARNFELDTDGGYRRIAGYERFDGRPKPSDAVYHILNLTITGSISVGDTVMGGTSSATGVVLAVVTTTTPNYLVLTKVTGAWVVSESVMVSGTPRGTTLSVAIMNGASSSLLHAKYTALAADNYRADIGQVPGSGPILGVVELNDVVYAFRNNAAGTAAAIYKSSPSGWTAVPLSEEIGFSNANTNVNDGDVLTQGGVTATIQRVVVQTGTLSSGTNTGRLIITNRTGGDFAAGSATSTGGGSLTLSGVQTAITLQPNGKYEFIVHNFTGSTATKRIYGVDGVNRGFEFDGTVFVPIVTGMAVDKPERVCAHKNHLFFSFKGSVQHSSIGNPYSWSPVTGAAELAMGEDVTAFMPQPGSAEGGALAIFTRNRLHILYGSGSSSWNLVTYRSELGAYARTVQDVGYTVYLDDRGITTLETSANYGNFASNTMTDHIRTTLNELRTTAQCSCISRDLSQYRVFFSIGRALYLTFRAGKFIGAMPIFFPITVRCVWSGERLNGAEAIYFGSDSGYVYEMNKGTSFDGTDIEASFSLAYSFQKAPRINKRYRTMTLEIKGPGYATIDVGYALGYSLTDIPQPQMTNVEMHFGSAFWDTFTWDAFTWDGTTLSPSSLYLDGEAENISVAVKTKANYIEPFTITTALIHYSILGRMRA